MRNLDESQYLNCSELVYNLTGNRKDISMPESPEYDKGVDG